MRRLLVALLLVLTAVGACTSSGGIATPGAGTVENKLRTDPLVRQALARTADNAKAQALAYACIAKAVLRDADTSGVVAYVSGRKSLRDIGGSKIVNDIEGCATTSLKQAVGG